MNEHRWLCLTTLQLNLSVSVALRHYGLLVCPAHPRAMLYALKIVTDLSLLPVRSYIPILCGTSGDDYLMHRLEFDDCFPLL